MVQLNVISASTDTGVWINGASNTSVLSNHISTDQSGATAVPNDVGVWIDEASNGNVISGNSSNTGNVISGNTSVGVALVHTSGANSVVGNLIGTDPTGSLDLGNGTGVTIANSGGSSTIGDVAPGARNIIAGNDSTGVFVSGLAIFGNTVRRNFIGTSRDGMSAIPNGAGVLADDAADTFSANNLR